jgi:hypothetical protein
MHLGGMIFAGEKATRIELHLDRLDVKKKFAPDLVVLTRVGEWPVVGKIDIDGKPADVKSRRPGDPPSSYRVERICFGRVFDIEIENPTDQPTTIMMFGELQEVT